MSPFGRSQAPMNTTVPAPRPWGRRPPGAFAQVPRRGNPNDPIRAALGPVDPALGSRPDDGCLVRGRDDRLYGLRPVVRLPQHFAAPSDGVVVRLADPAVAAAAARGGHEARGEG